MSDPYAPVQDEETIQEVTATQIQNSGTESVVTPVTDEEVEAELKKVDIKTLIAKTEKNLLRLVSIALLVHGVLNIYEELIEIFYVFPYLDDLFRDVGYTASAYESLYRKSLLISATALTETVYGLAIIAKLDHLVHRLHIFSGISLLVISIFLSFETKSLEELDVHHILPEAPTIENLIHAETIEERIHLFTNLGDQKEASSSSHK